MSHRIQSPHKQQDGWAYIRVEKDGITDQGNQAYPFDEYGGQTHFDGSFKYARSEQCVYDDEASYSRVISSRKVEEAVETLEYLRLCAFHGLAATYLSVSVWVVGEWHYVGGEYYGGYREGKTLREAYWRFKNAKASNE